MKKIKYRQYYYGGDYSNEELNLPDNTYLYEFYPNVSYEIDDIDNWTKSYVILSKVKFDDALRMGDIYLDVLEGIFIEENEIPISKISSSPKFNNTYTVRYYRNREVIDKFNDLIKDFDPLKITKIEAKKINKLAKNIDRISSISKLKRITPDGIEITRVLIENEITGKPEYLLESNIIKYNRIHLYTYTNNPNIGKLFKIKCEEVYNYLV